MIRVCLSHLGTLALLLAILGHLLPSRLGSRLLGFGSRLGHLLPSRLGKRLLGFGSRLGSRLGSRCGSTLGSRLGNNQGSLFFQVWSTRRLPTTEVEQRRWPVEVTRALSLGASCR
jgi:hypothetical protein